MEMPKMITCWLKLKARMMLIDLSLVRIVFEIEDEKEADDDEDNMLGKDDAEVLTELDEPGEVEIEDGVNNEAAEELVDFEITLG
jgi:hypothetical protein